MTRFTLFSSQLLPCCPPCGTVAIKATGYGWGFRSRRSIVRGQDNPGERLGWHGGQHWSNGASPEHCRSTFNFIVIHI